MGRQILGNARVRARVRARIERLERRIEQMERRIGRPEPQYRRRWRDEKRRSQIKAQASASAMSAVDFGAGVHSAAPSMVSDAYVEHSHRSAETFEALARAIEIHATKPAAPEPTRRSGRQALPTPRIRRLVPVSCGRRARLWVLSEQVENHIQPTADAGTQVSRREWLALAIAVFRLTLRTTRARAKPHTPQRGRP